MIPKTADHHGSVFVYPISANLFFPPDRSAISSSSKKIIAVNIFVTKILSRFIPTEFFCYDNLFIPHRFYPLSAIYIQIFNAVYAVSIICVPDRY